MKNNKKLRNLIIVVVVLIILAIIGKKAGWFGKVELTRVSTEKVMRRTITEVVSASGKIQPEVEVKISADVSGEIVELHVREGDQVSKGQLLAKNNPDIYTSMLERMSAALNTAKANLANMRSRLTQAESQFNKTELNYNRNKQLFDNKAISTSDFESIKSAYEVSRAELEGARQAVVASEFEVKSGEASLKESSDNLRKTSIFAPVNGTVSKLNVEQGERVVGTSQMSGTEIMRIANLHEMEVSVDVNESDIVRVHMSDTAVIEVDAWLNRKFKGIVTEIANTASSAGVSTDQVTNFTVKVRILQESYADLLSKERPDDSPFRPGMSATIDIQTKTMRDVLSIPVQAVTTRDTVKANEEAADKTEKEKTTETKKSMEEHIEECVFALDSGKAVLRTVKTGVQDNNYIEIVSGLKENQEIITAPYSAVSKTLKHREQVEVVDKEQLFDIKGK